MDNVIRSIRFKGDEHRPYVTDDGIYAPVVYDDNIYEQCIMTKEMFIEAYNKWIKRYKPNTWDDCEWMNDD